MWASARAGWTRAIECCGSTCAAMAAAQRSDGDYKWDVLAADVKGALDVLDSQGRATTSALARGMIGQGFCAG